MKKYELLKHDVKISISGVPLFRVRYLKTNILGGYIQSEKNLSQEGDAWIGGDARIGGNAWIVGDDFLVVGPLGSRRAALTITRTKDGQLYAATGCYHGPIAEFLRRVEATHGQSCHVVAYRLAIELAKAKLLPPVAEATP